MTLRARGAHRQYFHYSYKTPVSISSRKALRQHYFLLAFPLLAFLLTSVEHRALQKSTRATEWELYLSRGLHEALGEAGIRFSQGSTGIPSAPTN